MHAYILVKDELELKKSAHNNVNNASEEIKKRFNEICSLNCNISHLNAAKFEFILKFTAQLAVKEWSYQMVIITNGIISATE